MTLTPEEEARFRSKFVADKGNCWLWTGPLDRDGYGRFYFRRLTRRAHRVAWYWRNGEIGDMVVNHVCRTRHCVNPQHLELVTRRENALRDTSSVAAVNARKKTCVRGHPFDLVVHTRRGFTSRGCSVCERDKKKRLRAKWQAEDTLAV